MPSSYFGKYTGIVKDNRDDEMLGQLQVSVPAIFPRDEMVIARAALPYGFFFVPEVEAKVWIEFEGGDPGLPLWTGVQYVPGEWAAEAEVDPPTKRVIKTAKKHLLIFNDTEGEESIEIRDGKNGHIILADQAGIQITDGVNNHVITINGNGITLEAAGDIAIKGQSINIEAKAKLALKGNPIHLNP
jgi:uncharacterized protein involved in type VI secretion and phage assembly